MRVLAGLSLTVAALVCCTSGARAPVKPAASGYSAVAPPRPGGTVVLLDFEYPSTLNPLMAQTDIEVRLGGLLFAPLWGLDPKLRPYADLARQVPTPENGGVRVARDGLSMTVDVKLVPGLRWSDGQPITADDVIFTWRSIIDPPTRGRLGYDRIRDMDRRSDTELVWTLDGLYPAYLQLGAHLFVMPAHRLEPVARSEWPVYFTRPDVVSGPFSVLEAAPADHLVFAANPQYTDGRAAQGAYTDRAAPFRHRPYLERVVFTALAGKAAEVRALAAGAADVGFHLLPDDLPDLQAIPSGVPVVTTGLRDEFLNPNHAVNRGTGQAPPWVDDPTVLQALDRALDRAALVQELTAGVGRTARGIYPRALTGAASMLPEQGDLDGARRLLDAAGWAPGAGGVRAKAGRRLEFSLVGICGRAGLDNELDRLRRQWLPLGAAVTTSCQNRGAFLRLNEQGAFDMTVYSNQWAPDPGAWAAVGASGQPGNWNRCQDVALDAALAHGEATLTVAARKAAYRDAEREWLRYRCTIPLFEVPEVRQTSTRLRNFVPNPAAPDTWNAADWWLGQVA